MDEHELGVPFPTPTPGAGPAIFVQDKCANYYALPLRKRAILMVANYRADRFAEGSGVEFVLVLTFFKVSFTQILFLIFVTLTCCIPKEDQCVKRKKRKRLN